MVSRYLQRLISVGAIRRLVFNLFLNQNFSRQRKTKLLRKWITLVLQGKLRFMGCLVTANDLVLGKNSVVVIIAVNSISFYETVICKEIFSKYYIVSIFLNFQKILEVHENTLRKVLESSQKYTHGKALCILKCQSSCRLLQEQPPERSVKKVFFNKVAFVRL